MLQVIFLEHDRVGNGENKIAEDTESAVRYGTRVTKRKIVGYLVDGQGHAET